MKYTIDRLQEYSQQGKPIQSIELFYFCGLIVLITLGYGTFRFGAQWFIIRTSRIIEFKLRNDFLAQLQKQAPAYFQQIRTGDLMARATSDLHAVRLLVGPGLLQPAKLAVTFSVGLIFMLSISPELTMYLLIPVPLGVAIVYVCLHFIQKVFKEVQEKFSEITAFVQENIAGMRVIKGYLQETNQIEAFGRLNDDYITSNIRLAKIRSFLWSSMMSLLGVGNVVLLWFGGKAIVENTMTIGDLVAFTMYLYLLAWPIISIGWVLNIYKRAVTSMTRLNEIFQHIPDISDGPQTETSMNQLKGKIEFREVNFRYQQNLPWVLKNLDFTIHAGETVAFVGPTGCGKSSIIQLITRSIESTQGQILIDDNDIRTIPLTVLRAHIGLVAQTPFLFSDTIRENIRLGKNDASDTQIVKVAQIAQLMDEINEFPDKLDTMLGERGMNLSGGQKQRLALARALIGQPQILILDDALSSVDTHTEEKILADLNTMMQSRTCILIAHRISTIKNAHTIFVIDEGRIVEKGKHHTLIRQGGLYARLYEQQLLQESLAEIE